MSLVEALNSRGEFGESVKVIAESEVAPSDEGQLRKIVSTCRDGGHLEISVPYVEAFVSARPSSGLAHYLFAKVLAKTGGDLGRAREHYQTAVQINPQLEDDVLAAKLDDLGDTMPHTLPEETAPAADDPAGAEEEALAAEPEPEQPAANSAPAPTATLKASPVAEPEPEPAKPAEPSIQSLTPPPGITTFQKLPSPAQVPAENSGADMAAAAGENVSLVETASHTGRYLGGRWGDGEAHG